MWLHLMIGGALGGLGVFVALLVGLSFPLTLLVLGGVGLVLGRVWSHVFRRTDDDS
jgi:hypothetical protein